MTFHELYDLMEWTIIIFGLTAGILPAIIGYNCGRHLPLGARVLPAAWIILTGYMGCAGSYHYYYGFVWGMILYILFDAWGLHRRAKQLQKKFWDLHHVDWLSLGGAALVFMVIYTHPIV
jgi:hypothetical protein